MRILRSVRRPQCPSQAGRYLPQADYLRLSGHRNRAGARGQVSPAGQAQLRGWLAWFAGREEVTFAGGGHHMAVHRRGAGLGRHHGASRRAGEGRKRHAKTGGTNSRTPPSGMSACQLRLGGLLSMFSQRSDLLAEDLVHHLSTAGQRRHDLMPVHQFCRRRLIVASQQCDRLHRHAASR